MGYMYFYAEKEVKSKLKSLRAQYTRERQKVNKRRTGTGVDEVYNSKWPFYEQLKFLDDHVMAKSSISNMVCTN